MRARQPRRPRRAVHQDDIDEAKVLSMLDHMQECGQNDVFCTYTGEEAKLLHEWLENTRKALISAECVVRQVARDTFGKDMSVKEFAEQSSYDH
jgi:hypothetical protein